MTRNSLNFIIVVILLASIGFALNLYVTMKFDSLGAYNKWEVLFGSDPNWYLSRLTEGLYSSKRHPLFHVFIYPPVVACAKLINAATDINELYIRRQLIILVPPIVGAIKTVLLLFLTARFGIPLRFGVLVALIDIASLSRIVFGSIPESFGATAAVLTWAFYLASREINPGERLNYRAWLLCGLFGFGVTLTNIVPFFILLMVSLRPDLNGWRSSMKRCIPIVMVVLISGALLHIASQLFVKPDPKDISSPHTVSRLPQEPTMTKTSKSDNPLLTRIKNFTWLKLSNIRKGVWFRPSDLTRQIPLMAAWTFAGPEPIALPANNPLKEDNVHPRSILKMPINRLSGESLLLFALVITALSFGAYGFFIEGSALRWLGLAVAGILMFNLVLFTFWGMGQLFIFTLHWQPCLLVILAGSGYVPGRLGRTAFAACGLLLITEIIWNARFLNFVFNML